MVRNQYIRPSSDLHIFDGVMPAMDKDNVIGHETMGEVVEVGRDNKKPKVGDRVVVPFTISCGECFFCARDFYSGCERSNPNQDKAAKMWGGTPAALSGYLHLLGEFTGGQADYLRVPCTDVGPPRVPDHLTDEQVLFPSDIFPTRYMAADFCSLRRGGCQCHHNRFHEGGCVRPHPRVDAGKGRGRLH